MVKVMLLESSANMVKAEILCIIHYMNYVYQGKNTNMSPLTKFLIALDVYEVAV